MTNVVRRVFGDKLYKKRMEYAISQERMSEMCALSPRQYGDIENCKRLPRSDHLITIAIRCNLDLNEIVSEIKENIQLE